MNIGRIFASAVIRKVAYWVAALIIAAVVSFIGMGEAHAQEPPSQCPNLAAGCTKEVAHSSCMSRMKTYATQIGIQNPTYNCNDSNPNGTGQGGFTPYIQGSNGYAVMTDEIYIGCPAGSTWNNTTKTCFSSEECLAKNTPALNAVKPSLVTERCLQGCRYAMPAGTYETSTSSVLGSGTPTTYYRGGMEFTGEACPTQTLPSVEVLPPTPPPPVCAPVAGQTLCIKPNGEHCTMVSGTRQICFKPGETGPKTDGPTLVDRNPGETPPPTPTKPPPPGETFQQQGNPFKTTTTSPTGTTTITNTTIYNTTNGTNASGPGGTDSGEGKEGGTEGGAAGGTSCEDPPIVSGDEPLRMVATQAWATRCAVEAGNTAKVTGDVGDCASPYTVEGDNANAEQLRALRAQICPNEGEGDSIVDQSGIAGDGDATSLGFIKEGAEFGTDGLNIAGFGYSRACPAMPSVSVFGQTIQFDNSVMCNWLQLAGALVLVLAALASIRILSGGV
jgi:hypothetical protein